MKPTTPNGWSRDDIRLALQDIFRDIFDDDALVLNDGMTADDIDEWDSLNQIKIILRAEERFGHALNARRISTLENVGGMIDYLEETMSASRPG